VKWQNCHDGILVHQVQLGDLEDAAHIPPGCDMVGKQAVNWMWRSPEAHARGRVNKPSDVFSFALVVSLPYPEKKKKKKKTLKLSTGI